MAEWMIKGPQSHVFITLTLMGLSFIILGTAFYGGFFAVAYYIGRELAQAEERTIRMHYGGRRENMPLGAGFHKKAWNRKSVLDWVLPLVVFLPTVLF
jgi:hypothetical protein